MKILVLGSRIPYPLNDGGAIATFNMLKEMAAQGCEVTFFSYNTKKHFVKQHVLDEQFYFCKVIQFYLDAEIKWYKAIWNLFTGRNYNISRFISVDANAKLRELFNTNEYDIIHFEGLYSVPFLGTVISANTNSVRVIRQHNVEYTIWEKLAVSENGVLKKWYLKSLTTGLKKYEIQAICSFNYILAIAETDAEIFRQINPKANVFYYPAGLDVIHQSHLASKENSLYHIGSMEWMPNKEGLKWFIEKIFPEVIKLHPHVTLHIAGKGLLVTNPDFSGKNIVNHGEISDAIDFHNRHGIMIVPLFSGSGLRIKLIEAMSLAKPVISTSIGAAGIAYTAGKELLIADKILDWVEKLDELLSNESKRLDMGANAQNLVLRDFSNQGRTHELINYYKSILNL